jgi:hypothetical protein
MSIIPVSGRPLAPIPSPGLTPPDTAAQAAGGVLTAAGALLPDAPGLAVVGGLAKPILAGVLGVDQDKLEGMSPLAILSELIVSTKAQQAEGKREIITSAVGAASKAFQGVESAADNYDVDIGQAILKWGTNPQNLEKGFKFASEVVTAVVAAVASGGGSLIKDLPALGASALTIADSILKESGYSLQEVLGKVATDALVGLGVEPETAKKLGPFLASAGIAAGQAYAAYNSGDFSKLDAKVFGDVVRHGSSLLGASDGTAATLGTLTAGGMSLGLAISGGNSELLNSGNLSKLLASGNGIAGQLQAMAEGNGVDMEALKGLVGIFVETFPAVLGDLEKDTGIPNIATTIQSKLGDIYENLGPFKDVVSIGMDLLQQGFGSQRNMI